MSSIEEFLAVLVKSDLLESGQFAEAESLAAQSPDPQTLAQTLVSKRLISRWQAGQLLAGQTLLCLGNYRLVKLLSCDGAGAVFDAEHKTMQRREALKLVPRSVSEDSDALDRFFHDAGEIAAVNHPNIVQAFTVGFDKDKGLYFIPMEFVQGLDLQRLVETEGRLSFERAADYIRQAAEGLAYAHSRNLVHTDIQPSNLLVDMHNTVKILNLGLSRINRAAEISAQGIPAKGAQIKRPGETPNAADYRAPEQRLDPANITPQSDIYSLGCTFYYLLTGRPPLGDRSTAQATARHKTPEPRSLFDERPDAPRALVEICQRMMALAPGMRFQAAELVSALAPWRTTATPPPVVPIKATVDDDIPLGASGASWFEAIADTSLRTAAHDSERTRTTRSSIFDTPAIAGSAANTPANSSANVSAGTRAQPPVDCRGEPRKKRKSLGVWAWLIAQLNWLNTPQRAIVAALSAGLALLVVGAAVMPLSQSGTNSELAQKIATNGDDASGAAPHASTLPAKDSGLSKTILVPKPNPTEVPKVQPTLAPPKATPAPAALVINVPRPMPQPQSAPVAQPAPVVPAPIAPAPQSKPATWLPLPVALDGLHSAVDLPAIRIEGTDAISLGSIVADPKALIEIKLLGGEVVAKSMPKYIVEPDPKADQSLRWLLVAESKDKSTATVGRLWRDADQIKFQWSDEARNKANLVRNCGLLVSGQGSSKFVALSSPKIVDGVTVDFDAGQTRLRLIRDNLPEASMLRMQLLPLDSVFPKHEFRMIDGKPAAARAKNSKELEMTAGDTISTKGKLSVVFKDQKTPDVELRLSFDTHPRGVSIEMHAMCDMGDAESPFVLSTLQKTSAGLNAFLMIADAANYKSGRKPPAIPQGSVQAAKATLKQIEALANLSAELNRKAKIPFKIYTVTDNTDAHKVVLFEGTAADDPAAGIHLSGKGKKIHRADDAN